MNAMGVNDRKIREIKQRSLFNSRSGQVADTLVNVLTGQLAGTGVKSRTAGRLADWSTE